MQAWECRPVLLAMDFSTEKIVAVVGGGDTACEEAEYLSHLASKVYLIVRKNFLRASNIMQRRVNENPNIEILFETQAEGLFGENRWKEYIWLKAKTQRMKSVTIYP